MPKQVKEKKEKKSKDFSDMFWIGRVLVVISIAYSASVILSGLYGELIPAIMVTPMCVYGALLLYRGK